MKKNIKLRFIVFCILSPVSCLLLLSGCGSKDEASITSAPTQEVRPAAVKSFDPESAGTLKGVVKFEGEAPAPKKIPVKGNPECSALHPGGEVISEELLVKEGALQNVFVYVKEGLEDASFEIPTQPVTVSNQKCTYVPHVSGVQVGQPLVLLNEDSTLHNIHSYSKNSPAFNVGLPFQGVKQIKKFMKPEVMVTLKCDVHPWMIGYLGVLEHPYFGVTGEDGAFELKNLPPGEYLVEAWHEKLGTQSQKITIEPRETKEIVFTFKG